MNISNALRGLASLLALASIASCADTDPELLGTATAAILTVPTDVSCLDITVTGGSTVTRRFTVTPGASATLTLRGLPVGVVTFAGVAYPTACRNVSTTTDASWVSPSVRATLGAGVTTAVTLPLYRAPTGAVSVDFRDAGAVACGPANRGDCDGDAVNGCETNLSTNVLHCGACGAVCRVPNATQACAGGLCAVGTCTAGYGNCDAMAANGCETNVNTDASHCGACGRACNLPHATAVCAAGACALGACTPGFADCDGNAANGCELDVSSDVANCGACARHCALSFVCQSSECVPGNQSLATASPIDMASTVTVSVTYDARRASPADLGNLLPSYTGGPPPAYLFYTFTLTEPEVVSVVFMPVLGNTEMCFVRSAAGVGQRYVGRSSGETVCVQHTGTAEVYRATASFPAGTWYLALGSYPTGGVPSRGSFYLEHLPVGNAVPVFVPYSADQCRAFDSGSLSTSGTGVMSSCTDATGPELSYWWIGADSETPSGPLHGSLNAYICRADFDAVLTYAHAGEDTWCTYSTPSSAGCGSSGLTYSTIVRPGLQVLTVDGRNGASGHPNLYFEFGPDVCLPI